MRHPWQTFRAILVMATARLGSSSEGCHRPLGGAPLETSLGGDEEVLAPSSTLKMESWGRRDAQRLREPEFCCQRLHQAAHKHLQLQLKGVRRHLLVLMGTAGTHAHK